MSGLMLAPTLDRGGIVPNNGQLSLFSGTGSSAERDAERADHQTSPKRIGKEVGPSCGPDAPSGAGRFRHGLPHPPCQEPGPLRRDETRRTEFVKESRASLVPAMTKCGAGLFPRGLPRTSSENSCPLHRNNTPRKRLVKEVRTCCPRLPGAGQADGGPASPAPSSK